MPNNEEQFKASDILRELHELLQEPEQDVIAMPLKDIQAELIRRGIDTGPLLKRVKQQLAKAKADAELSVARSQREDGLQRLKSLAGKLTGTPSALRERILSTLGKLSVGNPTVATAYFNKFEEASDADLQSLLDDLSSLDESDDNKDTSSGT
jgi:hypothetical protein